MLYNVQFTKMFKPVFQAIRAGFQTGLNRFPGQISSGFQKLARMTAYIILAWKNPDCMTTSFATKEKRKRKNVRWQNTKRHSQNWKTLGYVHEKNAHDAEREREREHAHAICKANHTSKSFNENSKASFRTKLKLPLHLTTPTWPRNWQNPE